MNTFEVEIEIDPVPWTAPYVGGKHAYSIGKFRQFKKNIPLMLLMSKDLKEMKEPFDGPLKASFYFYMPMPKSWSKEKRKEMLGQWHSQRPDQTNMEKAIEDCLNGKVYHDDAQIVCKTHCGKEWAEKGLIYIKIKKLT